MQAMFASMNLSLSRVILITAVVILGSSLFVLSIPGYGTILSQFLVLNAWSIVAGLTSQEFADTQRGLVWAAVAILNIAVFLIPTVAIWLAYRHRRSSVGVLVMVAWCVVYLACLFLLFPASDGP